MRLAQISFLILSFFGALSVASGLDDQATKAKQDLQRQIDLLDSVKPYVERQDLGRLILLRLASQEVLDAINTKGPLNLITIHAYENLILKYRYSTVYFEAIATSGTEPALKEAQSIAEEFAKQLNFDDAVYTQITFSTYDEMYRQVLQLLQMTIPKQLRDELEALKPTLGQLTAMAKGGDNFDVYAAAVPCAEQVKKMYQLFYSVPSSDQAFNAVMAIQGLNEWYIEKTHIPVKSH